jgi:hypothetical protein
LWENFFPGPLHIARGLGLALPGLKIALAQNKFRARFPTLAMGVELKCMQDFDGARMDTLLVFS